MLTNSHHAAFDFRISRELHHAGWRVAFDTARPRLGLEKELVGRSRLVRLAPRSLVLLCHDR
jgi:hypothetical protein